MNKAPTAIAATAIVDRNRIQLCGTLRGPNTTSNPGVNTIVMNKLHADTVARIDPNRCKGSIWQAVSTSTDPIVVKADQMIGTPIEVSADTTRRIRRSTGSECPVTSASQTSLQ